MAFTDARDIPITTQSAAAAAACSASVENFLKRGTQASALLAEALDHDPNCVYALVLKGHYLNGLRKSTLQDEVAGTLSLAQKHVSQATEREQCLVEALAYSVNGEPAKAVSCYEKVLKQYPLDLFALTFAQGELFWTGDMQRSAKISRSVKPAWQDDVPGYAGFLANHAFDLEEIGDYTGAEAAGRLSVDIENDNVWGTHAVAHLLLMQGRFSEGVDWLDDLHSHWEKKNQFKFHLWWHQCLFLLEQRENEAALAIYDEWIRNAEHPLTIANPDFYLDLQNGASLLWRLEAQQVNVGDRWEVLAAVIEPRYLDMTSPFTSAHIAMIFAATGQFDHCSTLINTMEQFVHSSSSGLAHSFKAAIPAAKAAVSHRQKNFSQVIAELLPMRSILWNMGGSHAQQDVFYQLLYDAARRCEQTDVCKQIHEDIEQLGFVQANRVAYS